MIVSAAIRIGGVVLSVPRPGRHHDVIREAVQAGFPAPVVGEQGFVTSTGCFVGREEAARIAATAGQILPVDGIAKRETNRLFSEDVW